MGEPVTTRPIEMLTEGLALGGETHPDFPCYWVFRNGVILSVLRPKAALIKGMRVGKYLAASLRDRRGVVRKMYLHRFIAETFHGLPQSGLEVRHLDGNSLNNSGDNLAWGTRSQNMRDKELHGTAPKGSRHGRAKLSEGAVVEMRRLYRAGAALPTLVEKFGVSRSTCWRAVTGQNWSHIKEG
jgi:hypothetical protein